MQAVLDAEFIFSDLLQQLQGPDGGSAIDTLDRRLMALRDGLDDEITRGVPTERYTSLVTQRTGIEAACAVLRKLRSQRDMAAQAF